MSISPKDAVAAAKNYDEGTLKRYIRQEFCQSLVHIAAEVESVPEASGSAACQQSLSVIEALQKGSTALLSLVGLEARRRRLTTLAASSFRPVDASEREELEASLLQTEKKLSAKTFVDLFSLEVFGGGDNGQLQISQAACNIIYFALQLVAATLSCPQQVITVGKGEVPSSNGSTTTTTLLHLAAYAGATESVDLLLAFGADPNAEEADATAEGTSLPLPSEVTPKKKALMALSSSLILTSPSSPTVMERTLMSKDLGSPINAIGRAAGKTPLHWAAFEGHTDVCRQLLSVPGQEVQAPSAAKFAWLPLVECVTNPTPADGNGQTPCHLALLNAKIETARLLPNYEECLRQRSSAVRGITIDQVTPGRTEMADYAEDSEGTRTAQTRSTANAKSGVIEVKSTSAEVNSVSSNHYTAISKGLNHVGLLESSKSLPAPLPPAVAATSSTHTMMSSKVQNTSSTNSISITRELTRNHNETNVHSTSQAISGINLGNAIPSAGVLTPQSITFEMDEEERELRKMILRETLQRKADKRLRREERQASGHTQSKARDDLALLKGLIDAINNASDAIRSTARHQGTSSSQDITTNKHSSEVRQSATAIVSSKEVSGMALTDRSPVRYNDREGGLEGNTQCQQPHHQVAATGDSSASHRHSYGRQVTSNGHIVRPSAPPSMGWSSHSREAREDGAFMRVAEGAWTITGTSSTSLLYRGQSE